MKLSLQSFKDSFYYTNDNVNRIPELKSYLRGRRNQQGALAVKVSRNVHVRQLLCHYYDYTYFWLVAWLSGNALVSINEVNLRRARLVLGWVTVCERANHLGM